MKVGALIPCFNEEVAVTGTVKGTLAYLPEAIVVDDGSTDDTARRARQAGAEVLRHSLNQGKGAALKTGFSYVLQYTDWQAVIILDGDGQHDWTEIPKFIVAAQYCSLVLGNRMGQAENMPLVRWLTNKFMSWLISRLTGQQIPDSQCGYRLLKRDLLKDLHLRTCRYDTETEILFQAAAQNYQITSVPVGSIYRGETSYINSLKDTIRFIRLIKTWFNNRRLSSG